MPRPLAAVEYCPVHPALSSCLPCLFSRPAISRPLCPAPFASLPIRLALPAHTSEGRGGNARNYPDLWRLNAAGSCVGAVPAEGRGGNARNYPDLRRPLSTAQSIPPCHPASPVCFPALRFPVHFVHAPSAGLPIRLALPAHTSEGRGGNARICPDLWRRADAESCAEEVLAEGRGGNARIYPNLWRPLSTATFIQPCHPASPVCFPALRFPALRFPVHFVQLRLLVCPSALLYLPTHQKVGEEMPGITPTFGG